MYKNDLKFSIKKNDLNYCYSYYLKEDYKDLKIIIGVDAHDPELLGSNNIKLVEDFTNELGLKVLDKMEY